MQGAGDDVIGGVPAAARGGGLPAGLPSGPVHRHRLPQWPIPGPAQGKQSHT